MALNYQDAYRLAKGAGATDEEARLLAALPGAESGYDPSRVSKPNKNGTIDRGLWQINSVHSQYDAGKLLDPTYNAKAALQILRDQGPGAWTVYNTGAYRKFMPANLGGAAVAGAAVGQSAGTAQELGSQLTQALDITRGEPVAPVETAATAGAAGAATGAATGAAQKAIDAAESAVGKPYVWGGNDLSTGVDCSGLIQQAYKAAGISLPRVSNDQARAGTAVPLDQMQPGDILWWDFKSDLAGADHVALYLGNGKMVEALHRGAPVHIVDVRRPDGVTRVTGSSNVESTGQQVEVGPDDSIEARLAAISAAMSSPVHQQLTPTSGKF